MFGMGMILLWLWNLDKYIQIIWTFEITMKFQFETQTHGALKWR